MVESVLRDADRDATTVMVVGASSGIGRETVLRFAARGANVVLAARSEAALRQVAAACWHAGAADVLMCPTDVGDAGQTQATFDEAVHRFGRVDVAVNTAAVAVFGLLRDVPVDVFDTVIRTNLTRS